MLRWYLVHTKPLLEAVARTNLERQGYEVYFPRLLQPVRQRGRWDDAIVALFPRYLFVRVDEGRQTLSPLRSSVGVTNIVRFGATFAIVPDRVIGELRSREQPESGLHSLGNRRPWKPGTAVRIAMGPLTGLEGVFEREDAADRVVVLLNLLGRESSVRVPSGFVVPRLSA